MRLRIDNKRVKHEKEKIPIISKKKRKRWAFKAKKIIKLIKNYQDKKAIIEICLRSE